MRNLVVFLLLVSLAAYAQSSYRERQAEIGQRFDAEAARNQSYWQQHEQREQRMRENRDQQIEQNMQRDQHRERLDLQRRNHSNW